MPEETKSHHKEHGSIEWVSPGRPFKKRAKQYYLTGLLIMLLVEIILFLFSEYLLMAVVLSLTFMSFALAGVPPKDFKYKITTEGIQIEDKFFLWKELYDFYFMGKDEYETIHVRTEAYLPGELIVTFPKSDKEKIKHYLITYLPYREYVKPSFIDRAGGWLSKNFPLESK